jgi:hypothetical protein
VEHGLAAGPALQQGVERGGRLAPRALELAAVEREGPDADERLIRCGDRVRDGGRRDVRSGRRRRQRPHATIL